MDVTSESSLVIADEFAMHKNSITKELLRGLDRPSQKYINPKFFYDASGSKLFNQITTLPEYYPTRTEVAILQECAPEIAACAGKGSVLIEPGAGNCEKVRHLLADLQPVVYVPQDISAQFLYQTVAELNAHYPWLTVEPLVGDFAGAIELPKNIPASRRVLFYPGSTIGNFEPHAAVEFLRAMRELTGEDGGIIIGVDLQKDPEILNAAYNDSAGVTAEFNRNILHHVNTILGTDIDPEKFSHLAFYNDCEHRIEMHLRSEQVQQVDYSGGKLYFAKGETIHTEFSYKYTVDSFAAIATAAGFRLANTWLDKDRLFSVHYLEKGKGKREKKSACLGGLELPGL